VSRNAPYDDLMLCVGGAADGQWKKLYPGANQFVCVAYRPSKIVARGGEPPDMLDIVERHCYTVQTFKSPDEYGTLVDTHLLMWTELCPHEMFQKLLRGYSPQYEKREKVKV
jgi:hypothetical protein